MKRNRLNVVLPVVLIAVAALCSTGCENEDPIAPGTVRFGAVIDQSGSVARPQWADVAELALEHANEGLDGAGGVRGLRFELRVSDSNNQREVAQGRAVELRNAGVKGLITDTSEDAVSILSTVYDLDESNDVRVPTVCMACPAPSLFDPEASAVDPAARGALRDLERWGYRTIADSRPEARALLDVFLNDLPNRGDTNGDGQQKIGIEVINDLSGNDFEADLEEARDELFPGVILEFIEHEREIDVDGHSWNDDLIALTNDRNEQRLGRLDGRPDAILEYTFPLFAAALSRSYAEAGEAVERIEFLHHHNWRTEQILIKLGAFDLEGQSGISHAVIDNCETSGRTFVDAFEARVGRTPSYLDAHMYDAAMSLALATLVAVVNDDVDPSAVTPMQIRDAFARLSDKSAEAVSVTAGPSGFEGAVQALRDGQPIDYVGASGPVDFDEQGNVVGNFVKYRVMDGRFVDERTYDCVGGPTCERSTDVCSP